MNNFLQRRRKSNRAPRFFLFFPPPVSISLRKDALPLWRLLQGTWKIIFLCDPFFSCQVPAGGRGGSPHPAELTQVLVIREVAVRSGETPAIDCGLRQELGPRLLSVPFFQLFLGEGSPLKSTNPKKRTRCQLFMPWPLGI